MIVPYGAYRAGDGRQVLFAADIPVGAVRDLAAVADHPQLAGRWVEAGSPGGPVRALRPPFNIGGVEPPPGTVPALGEHTAEIRAELGLRSAPTGTGP